MSRINRKTAGSVPKTVEGANARPCSSEQELRKAVVSCLLFEDGFYESGEQIATRIQRLTKECSPDFVSKLMLEARSDFNLRHAPLWLGAGLAETGNLKAEVLTDTIQRPDEIPEFLAMLWKEGKRPIPNQVKKGLAASFSKFDAYQLKKYKCEGRAVSLRDAMFMVHPKPKDVAQEKLFKELADGVLGAANTWEVNLSKGTEKKTEYDKKEVWEGMLRENTIGAMALMRNLRNFVNCGVDKRLVNACLAKANFRRVNPYRFVAAVLAAPEYGRELNKAMLRNMSSFERMPGRTAIAIDTSASMGGYGWGYSRQQGKSSMRPRYKAAALAIMVAECCEEYKVFHFGSSCAPLPYSSGLGMITALDSATGRVGHGTDFRRAVDTIEKDPRVWDRIIIVSDMQSHNNFDARTKNGYCLNVGTDANSVDYGSFTEVCGFSEKVLDFIKEIEAEKPW